MRKAFTLVELLIVVTVIAILMGMVMRFGNIGTDAQWRNITITRMQRLENALSGYYAAFGTYPPVHLQGSRNIFRTVSDHGIQNTDGKENSNLWGWLGADNKVKDSTAEYRAWAQVKAACESQPVGCYYPYPDEDAYRDYVAAYSEALKAIADQSDSLTEERKAVLSAGFDSGTPIGRFGGYRDKLNWEDIQLFRFGLLSYLLPRYLFMMEGPEELFTDYAQWTGNNQLPCDPLRGTTYSGGWKRMRSDVNDDLARVANIPSQAVCARWMANFEKTLTCSINQTFFGVDVRSPYDDDDEAISIAHISEFPIYSPGGFSQDSRAGQYVLNRTTIRDGWRNELYYYSPAPYQSYVIWSSGPNGRTFPPWVARESLGADANKCIGYWTADDLVSLKH